MPYKVSRMRMDKVSRFQWACIYFHIPEYGVQGEVEVGVDILEVAISTWWVFRARKLRSVQTEEESEDWARLQVAGGQWGPTEDVRTSHEQGAKMSGPGS